MFDGNATINPLKTTDKIKADSLANIALVTKIEAKKSIEKGHLAFSFALRNFLDFFYAAPQKTKINLLKDEPMELRSILNDGGVADAYLAAMTTHLASHSRIPRPSWISKSGTTSRLPDKPWFALNSPEARIWLLTQSPAAFRERNLFISEDALSRA